MKEIKKLAVIGANGRMGRLFVNRSSEAGFTVLKCDRKTSEDDLREHLPQMDLVLLAVPLAAIAESLGRIAAYLREPTILADLASVKVKPVESLLAAYPGPVVGTHPLFGPEPPPDMPNKVAVVGGRDESAIPAVEDWLKRIGFIPFRCTPEEHDQATALIQGLNFITHAAYLSALAGKPELDDFITPSFKRRLDAAQKMFTEDLSMFAAIFEQNPFSHEAVRLFRSHLNVAAGGDIDLLLEHAAWWWRKDKSQKVEKP